MADEKKKPAEKKITITDLAAAVKELDSTGELQKAIDAGLVKAEIEEVEIEGGKFSGDYVKLTVGEKAESDTDVVRALVAIAAGNLKPPVKVSEKEGEEDEVDTRAPSVVKFFTYGADLAARSRTSQRIKAAAQGPEKSIERMAELLSKTKGISLEDAKAMVAALME